MIQHEFWLNIYWKFLKTFFRFLIFWYFLFICCCHHSWFQQQSYKLDWTLCYTARKFHYFLCRIRKSRSLIVVLWLQYSTTFCLLYHGRVIPKSMSTVIVLDDDLRAFNCFREQMVAMIHGVFNNSRVVCQGDSLPFTLANLAGPINLTRKLNISHMMKLKVKRC